MVLYLTLKIPFSLPAYHTTDNYGCLEIILLLSVLAFFDLSANACPNTDFIWKIIRAFLKGIIFSYLANRSA